MKIEETTGKSLEPKQYAFALHSYSLQLFNICNNSTRFTKAKSVCFQQYPDDIFHDLYDS